jgi:hypothetical protein
MISETEKSLEVQDWAIASGEVLVLCHNVEEE